MECGFQPLPQKMSGVLPKENLGETLVRLLKALKDLNPGDNISSNNIASYLYNPDSRISSYLKKLRKYKELENPTPQQRREAGDLLEQITVLTFCGLQGVSSIKSFRSAGPQYDLLVGGDGEEWLLLYKILYMKENRRDIVVEAKCTDDKVSDQQFARLCSIMEINLFQTTGLGVFFTLNGASGFPERGADTRQKQLKESKMRQVLFHAKTGKVVVLLDAEDIFALDKPASFIQILISKIRDLDYLSGLASLEPCETPELDLPKHLAPLTDKFMTN